METFKTTGVYSTYDWTANTETDAILSAKKSSIHLLPAPPPQIAPLLNYPEGDYDFSGNMEIFSETTFNVFENQNHLKITSRPATVPSGVNMGREKNQPASNKQTWRHWATGACQKHEPLGWRR